MCLGFTTASGVQLCGDCSKRRSVCSGSDWWWCQLTACHRTGNTQLDSV